MSETAVLPASDAGLIGSGQLILIVGPSGAGKDTLIGLAQNARAEDCRIIFPQRVVTRVASSFENNEAVTQTLFGQMLARSDFAFQWEAHGLRRTVSSLEADAIINNVGPADTHAAELLKIIDAG